MQYTRKQNVLIILHPERAIIASKKIHALYAKSVKNHSIVTNAIVCLPAFADQPPSSIYINIYSSIHL